VRKFVTAPFGDLIYYTIDEIEEEIVILSIGSNRPFCGRSESNATPDPLFGL
jgi:hypothetical protein